MRRNTATIFALIFCMIFTSFAGELPAKAIESSLAYTSADEYIMEEYTITDSEPETTQRAEQTKLVESTETELVVVNETEPCYDKTPSHSISENKMLTKAPYVKTISVTEDPETGEIITIKEYSDISLLPEHDETESAVRDVVEANTTTRSADEDIYISTYAQTFANKVDAAYTAIQSDAYVDMQTGSMAANVTDLYIPGKNGFDIRIDRTFNTKSSPMNEYYTKYYDEPFEIHKAYGYKYLCTNNNKEVYIYFFNEEVLFEALTSFRGRMYDSDEINYYGGLRQTNGEYEYVKVNDGTVREVLSSIFGVGSAGPYARDEEYIDVGYGWRLQVPFAAEYVRIYDDSTYTHKYLLQTRMCETVSFEFDTYRNSDGDRVASTINGKDGMGYKFAMVNKNNPEQTITHPAGFEYNITVTSKEGETYYLLWHFGQRIKLNAIVDRFNNIIRINMSENQCIITDSYGVVYECTNNGIRRIANGAATELVKYEWQTVNADFDTNDEYELDDEYIFTITRNSGTSNTISETEPNKTQYFIKQRLMYGRFLHGKHWLIYRLPYKVVAPTGLTRHFEYTRHESWPIGYPNDTKIGYYYYVTDYHETSDNGTNIKNHKAYTYTFNTLGSKYYVSQAVENLYAGDTLVHKVTNTYNRDGFLTIEKTEKSTKNTSNEYTYATGYPQGRVTQKINSIQSKTNTEKYQYKSDKLTKTIIGDYVCTNTYYEDNYYIPHTVTYKKDANTTIKTENLLTEDGKNIATKNVYENDVLKSTENYTYDNIGNLTSVTVAREDDTNAVIAYAYTYLPTGGYTLTTTQSGMVDADGNAVADIVTSQTFDWQGNLTSVTDANGNTTTTTYDLLSRPLTVTYPDTSCETYTYDMANNVSTLVTESDAKYYAYFDAWGNRVKTEQSSANYADRTLLEEMTYNKICQLENYKRYYDDTDYTQVSYTYNYIGKISAEKVYNESNNLLKTSTYTYYVGSNSTTGRYTAVKRNVTGDNGTYADYMETYDYLGNMIQAKLTSGDVQRISAYTFDYVGNMLTATDAKGNATTYTYDYANRPLTETNAAGNTKTYTYNSLGALSTESDYMNNTASYTYDNAGRVLTVTSPFDETGDGFTKNYYDPNGNVTRTMVKSNYATDDETAYNITDYGYDSMNRVAYTAVYPAPDSPIYTNYTYSVDGTNSHVISGNNSPSAANLSADAMDTEYLYDIYGNLISISHGDLLYCYTCDNQGRVTYVEKTDSTLSDFKCTQYTYDDFDNIITAISTSTYDDERAATAEYTYNLMGQRTSMTDITGTVNYTYSPFGELTQETKGGIIKSYTYDAVSNRTGFTLATDGVQQINSTYTYDALSRLTGYTSNVYSTAYTYDANSNIITATKPDGSVETTTYNLAGMPKQIVRTDTSNNRVDRYVYEYYYNGKLYSDKNFDQDLIYNRYNYDGAGRLTMDFCTGDLDGYRDMYTYDSRGNILSVEHTNNEISPSVKTTTNYTYDRTNRLLSRTDGTDTYTYTYLATGETSSVAKNGTTIRTYGYDANSRLISSVADGISTTYTYDGDNMRQSKTIGGITTNEIYDGADLVATTSSDSTNKYLRGFRLEVYQTPTESGMYTSGKSGSIIRTMPFDTDGNTSEQDYNLHGFTAFGKYQLNSATTNAINPFGYNGEVTDTDAGTDLIYLRNRYYDPEIGRFITVDPAMDGTNWYVYCGNDPVNYIDTLGLAPTKEEAAYMSKHVYKDYDMGVNGLGSRTIAGWTLIDIYDGGDAASIKIGIYIPAGEDWTNPSEYSLVFRGSTTSIDAETASVWANNLLACGTSASVDMWTSIGAAVWFDATHSQEITFIGHSKGGGEAIAAATATNNNAITFNAANFDFSKYGLSESNKAGIINYYVNGEFLSSLIGESRYGTNISIDTEYWNEYSVAGYNIKIPAPIKNHSMDAFKDAWGLEW